MGFHKKTIRDVPIDNQTVLVRVDFDLPLNSQGEVVDDFPIKFSMQTIDFLLERGCKVVVVSHLGQPNGRDLNCSLEPAAARLARLLKRDIRFIDGVIGDKVFQAVKQAPTRSVIVLENLRFYPEEVLNDYNFARDIVKSTGARYFVQDALGVVHNKHASTDAITAFVPSVAGLWLKDDYMRVQNIKRLFGIIEKSELPGIESLLDVMG